MTRTTTPRPKPPADPHERLRVLLAEKSSLPSIIETAQRATDIAAWMTANTRAGDIDAEIRSAEVDVARDDLEATWISAEAAHADEQQARAVWDAAQANFVAANEHATLNAVASALEYSARREHLTRLRLVAADHEQLWRTARDRTGLALIEVEALECRLRDLTGEEPAEVEGLRAPIAPLEYGVTISPADAGGLVHHLDIDDGTGSRAFRAGERPPRWVAVRLGPHLWVPPAEPEPVHVPSAAPAVPESVQYQRDVAAHARPITVFNPWG